MRNLTLAILAIAIFSSPLLAEKPRVALTALQAEGEGLAAQREALGNYLEQELLEVSAVSVPANPNALALALKSGAVEPGELLGHHRNPVGLLLPGLRHVA